MIIGLDTDTKESLDKTIEFVKKSNIVAPKFYCLTPKTIFKTSFDTGIVDTIGTNSGYTNILSYENNLILWTKNSKNIVSQIHMKSKIDKFQTICLYKGTIIVKNALDFIKKSLYNNNVGAPIRLLSSCD